MSDRSQELERLEQLKKLLEENNKNSFENNEDGYSKIFLPPGVKKELETVEPVPNNYNSNKAFINILTLSLISFLTEVIFLLIFYFILY